MGDQDLSVTGTSAKMEAYFVHRQEFGRDHSTFWIGHHTAGCYAWWKSLIIHFGTLCFTVTASHDCACHLSQILYTGQCLQIPICVCTVCMYVCAISHIMNSQDNVNLSSMTRLVCYNRDKSNGSKHSVWCAAMQSCTYVRMYSCSGGYANVTHKIWSPQWLAHSIHLFWACSADNKIIGFHWTANQIHRCNVGLISMQV